MLQSLRITKLSSFDTCPIFKRNIVIWRTNKSLLQVHHHQHYYLSYFSVPKLFKKKNKHAETICKSWIILSSSLRRDIVSSIIFIFYSFLFHSFKIILSRLSIKRVSAVGGFYISNVIVIGDEEFHNLYGWGFQILLFTAWIYTVGISKN